MSKKEFEQHLTNGRKILTGLLENKTAAKLDTYGKTIEWFKVLKEEIKHTLAEISEQIADKRIRLRFVDRGDTEAQLFIGSDVIVFNMHSNIFQLSPGDYNSQTSYVRQNPMTAYCGIIRIYNFLADSYEYNRLHDMGYLIGRIFINQEDHFMMEGKGQIGFMYRDFMHQMMSREVLQDIIIRICIHALNFDLYTPPYQAVQQTTVNDLNTITQSSKMKTGKRLGFKFESEPDVN